ncbi:pentatricopeptide repeat-containing protein 1, mitochondrial [Petromyzon marinus]|uniref:pentatricopeptide repeat-containing protein 1, mitochondrial n=1 Tax=Petromyzon marinus TaxID=7757 RepID=UPI003F6F14C6
MESILVACTRNRFFAIPKRSIRFTSLELSLHAQRERHSAHSLTHTQGGREDTTTTSLAMLTAAVARCSRRGPLGSLASLGRALAAGQVRREAGCGRPGPGCGWESRRAASASSWERGERTESAAMEDAEEEKKRLGNLSSRFAARSFFRKSAATHEEEDGEEEERVRGGRRDTAYWFHVQCKRLARSGQLEEALRLFEETGLKQQRLQPEEFNFTVLIGACARAGLTRRAFRLYNDMKKRGLTPSSHTYTALFNACAECGRPEQGLALAEKLWAELQQKFGRADTHLFTYHALLKVYARYGSLAPAINVLKEMVGNGVVPTSTTLSFLLEAARRDPSEGFRHALQLWRWMERVGVAPNLHNYSFLLSVARQCDIGDPAVATALLLNDSSESKNIRSLPVRSQKGAKRRTSTSAAVASVQDLQGRLFNSQRACPHPDSVRQDKSTRGAHEWQLTHEHAPQTRTDQLSTSCASRERAHVEECPEQMAIAQRHSEQIPQHSTSLALLPESPGSHLELPGNLLEPGRRSTKGHVLSLRAAPDPADRLALLGGVAGVLGALRRHGLAPNVLIFTQLAMLLPADQFDQDERLLQEAKACGAEPDVTLYNVLVGRRSRAGDLAAARALVGELVREGLSPDMHTYSALAAGCQREEDGVQLLRDMRTSGLTPNSHVCGVLISVAIRRLDYSYLTAVLKEMARSHIAASPAILRQLDFAARYPPGYDHYSASNAYLDKIDGFRGFYQLWLKRTSAVDDTAQVR